MKTYNTHIQFTENAIQSSCCGCPGGDRRVGVCWHRAAAIRFLAYERYCHNNSSNQPSGSYLELLDDSELLDDFAESSEEDDGFLYLLSKL